MTKKKGRKNKRPATNPVSSPESSRRNLNAPVTKFLFLARTRTPRVCTRYSPSPTDGRFPLSLSRTSLAPSCASLVIIEGRDGASAGDTGVCVRARPRLARLFTRSRVNAPPRFPFILPPLSSSYLRRSRVSVDSLASSSPVILLAGLSIFVPLAQ